MKNQSRTGLLLGAGALASGFLASLCCVGPLAFAALGLGSFGLAAFFDRARPLLGLLLLIFGAAGLYVANRKREVACEDGTCRMESAGAGTKLLLWIMAAAGAGLYFVPNFL